MSNLARLLPSATNRVAAGMRFMDGLAPGWRHDINVATLDIRSNCDCVIGQVFGSFNDYREKIFDYESPAHHPMMLGFFAFGGADAIEEFAELTREWKRALLMSAVPVGPTHQLTYHGDVCVLERMDLPLAA